MKLRQAVRIVIDIVMLLLLPMMMQYILTEQELHEWLGVLMAGLFIFHHILNFSWIVNVFRGKYTKVRILVNGINLLLLIDMFLLVFSGIVMSGMSGYVFEFLHFSGDMELYKKMHMLGAYWGFILMSFHLGQHWGYMVGTVRNYFPFGKSKRTVWILKGTVFFIIVYGLAAFFRQNMTGYLFLKTAAIYFDGRKAHISYLWDCIAIIVLFAALGHYLRKILICRKTDEDNQN